MTERQRKKKVCVIGAGAAGLCSARHFGGHLKFEVDVYEQTDNVGGTWVYVEETGLDKHGLPIHSSMYQDLRTNLPAKIMNFPDYPAMNAEEPCCVLRQEVLNYLKCYAEHFDVLKHIQFNTIVTSVRVDESAGGEDKWVVRIKRLKTGEEEELVYDVMMICNGHYFEPYVPNIPGIETFPGTIIHSHSYRKPNVFAGKTVLVLGASASGIDIGIDLTHHASRVYLSHNTERWTVTLPTNMVQVTGVDRIEGERFILMDQTTVTADVFMFCTGYKQSFPFLHENCGIRVDDNYVTPLYKHLVNIDHPTMCFVGLLSLVLPFPLFHIQVQYFLAVLENRTSLPPRSFMLEDSSLKTAKKRHAHKLMEKQWDYNDSLADAGGYDRLPRFYRLVFEKLMALRKMNILNFKLGKLVISTDGETIDWTVPNRNVEG